MDHALSPDVRGCQMLHEHGHATPDLAQCAPQQAPESAGTTVTGGDGPPNRSDRQRDQRLVAYRMEPRTLIAFSLFRAVRHLHAVPFRRQRSQTARPLVRLLGVAAPVPYASIDSQPPKLCHAGELPSASSHVIAERTSQHLSRCFRLRLSLFTGKAGIWTNASRFSAITTDTIGSTLDGERSGVVTRLRREAEFLLVDYHPRTL
ncbi:unnamed protein product [Rangifer tarandus platyrhynchus]|uniref:Uncharacterized protein n=1 Tax=Rangifer tarandus platyrhynchus TaxID=3082113 RepID=A0ABN8XJ24_RANTA|nr:unnamed protein product [Rangifer tarandus platyrhynchus]